MPHYTGIGIVFLQTFQQSLERFFLFRSTGILRPVTGTMVTTAVVYGVTLRGGGGTTMNHNQVDAAVVLVLAAGQDGVGHFLSYEL